MEIMLIITVSLIVIGHTATAFFDGIFSRVLTYVTLVLHPIALIPMLFLSLPFEAVALLFLASAAYYTVISLFFEKIIKPRLCNNCRGGDET